jgi:type IV pilus assembly protein PilO
MLEKLNQQSMPVKIVIAVVLAALVGGGLYYSMVMPMLEKNKADAVTLAAKQKENDELRAFETKVADLDRQILALKQQLEIQKKIVPDEKDADKFIILLQDSANDSGIALRSLIAKNVVNREYYTEVPFAIEIDGSYYQVMNYFQKLSAQTRIVNVEALSMRTVGKSGKYAYAPTDSVVVTAIAKTFFSHDAAAAPATSIAKK